MKRIALISALLLTGFSQAGVVDGSYLQKSASEIRSMLGSQARPTVYVDRNACGEPSSNAMACGPSIISVGTHFMQDQERNYGNYVAKFILAHEWGHSVQFTRGIRKRAPMMELQADCVAGSFTKYAQTTLRYPSFIESAVLSARAAADYSEHGTPSQRDYYARYGYANGFSTCMNRV